MSGLYLNTITENASRLGMRLQESFSEHTKDLNIARGSSSLYLDAPDDKVKNIRKQLDSTSDREKLDAMKRLVALISKGRNVSEYFAQVVKNVASQNLEIRKLVYIYLLRYAEQEPDLALLSINTFQKDLTDINPLIRAMALRVLSGIKVPMIGSIVVLAIKKCSADISPYVRKSAALAIPKCHELDESHLPALINIISSLLKDRSPLSIGSVAVAFEAICSTRLDLLHQHYRRLCRVLVDVDEWGQIDLMNLLLRYVRTMLPRPVINSDGDASNEDEIDPDVQLLLTSCEPLLQSRNPAVVLAVARVFYYVGVPSQIPKITHPLLCLLSVSKEVERIVLEYLLIVSQSRPELFAPFYSRFLVRTDDLRQVKNVKIKLLLSVINIDNHQAILREFIDYSHDVDNATVSDAIEGIGRCARYFPDCIQQCLTALISMIESTYDVVVSSAVLVLKHLVQIQLQHSKLAAIAPLQHPLTIISHLARRIDDIRHAQARACIIWLVGQYSASEEPGAAQSSGIVDWAPDVLRKSAKSFTQETTYVKLQIVTLAAKLFVLCPSDRNLGLLSRYVFSLARYDLNYDVRDRARMLSSLVSGLLPTINGNTPQNDLGGVVLRREQVRLVLFEGKADVVEIETHANYGYAMLGSLSVVTGKFAPGRSFLPDWLEQGIEPSLRETNDDNPPPSSVPLAISSTPRSMVSSTPTVLTPTSGSSPVGTTVQNMKGPWTDLDKFYENTDEEETINEDEDTEDEESDGQEQGDHHAYNSGDDDDDESDESDENDEDGQNGQELNWEQSDRQQGPSR